MKATFFYLKKLFESREMNREKYMQTDNEVFSAKNLALRGERGKLLFSNGLIGCVTITLVLVCMAGCSKKKAEEPAKKEKKVEVFKDPVPNEKGEYEYNRRMPDRWKCTEDRDCMHTHLRPGNCCPNQCGVYAGTRQWVMAVRQMHYPVCRPFLHEHGFDICGTPECPPSKGIPRSVCRDGKCDIDYTPFIKGGVEFRQKDADDGDNGDKGDGEGDGEEDGEGDGEGDGEKSGEGEKKEIIVK